MDQCVRQNSAVVFLVFVIFHLLPASQGVQHRYSLESCADLQPRQLTDPSSAHWFNGRRKRSELFGQDPPFKITVPGNRYRKNTDLYVHIEGHGHYDGLMLQGRAINNGENIPGGVGLIGRFDPKHFPRGNYSYLDCFRNPYATIVDNGNSQRLGNATFVWTAPDSDVGGVRFLAGITQGMYFWIIASNILNLNPFPISTSQCGATEACFRVCPLDVIGGICGAAEALVIYSHHTDLVNKAEVEFTLGGRLDIHRSYLAVVYAEDNQYLYQADVVVCYVEHGRPQIAHLVLEVAGSNLLPHPEEEIALDDYDIDRNMLWCRFRRQIGHSAVINPWRSHYTLLYRGQLDLRRYPRFQTPSRYSMFSSDMKLNLSTPINKIYAGTLQLSQFGSGLTATATVAGLSCLYNVLRIVIL